MKIKKYKKISQSKYSVELDNGESLILYEDTIIKYNLLYKGEIGLDILNEILEYNDLSKAYDECIKFLCKRMHSKKEVIEFLKKNSYNTYIIDSCIERLENNNMINDEVYVKSYINDRINLSKDGPLKIERDLESLDINSDIIRKNIYMIDSDIIYEKIDKYISKKKNSNTKYSGYILDNKIRQELINLGFSIDMIDSVLSKYTENDDMSIIKKEYEKAYSRYSKKYKDKELMLKVKSYLYSKGYKTDDINLVCNN